MRISQAGFALPTILISSVVMFIVLVSAVSAATSINTGLDRQIYQRMAREAAESGVVRAVDCLKSNGYEENWSALYPGSSCAGTTSSCVTDGTCLLVPVSSTAQSKFRTYFSVSGATEYQEGDAQMITSVGRVQLLRPDNSVYETISSVARLRVADSDSVDRDDIDAIIFNE
jgi:Tfp pilus assembly protein PilX